MSYNRAQNRRRQRNEDEEQQPATDASASASAAAFDKAAPLWNALLRKGLSEQQIVQDNWTALMSLPQDAVDAVTSETRSAALQEALEKHATLDVLKVTPSSPLSSTIWFDFVARIAAGSPGARPNAAIQNLFGTAQVRDALVALHTQATTAQACECWGHVIVNLAAFSSANKQLFGTPSVRNALLALQPYVTSVDACIRWCGVISNVAGGNAANKKLFGTAGVRDALVALQPQATTADACLWWCAVITNMSTDHLSSPGDQMRETNENRANQQLFGTAAVRDALVALQPQATTASACQVWCSAIFSLTSRHPAVRQTFSTAAVRDALVAAHPHATTAGAVRWWCDAVINLTDYKNAANQLFCTTAVRDALLAMQPQATTRAVACQRWVWAVRSLITDNHAIQQMFGTAEVRAALVAMQPQVTTAEACLHWCAAVAFLAAVGTNRMLFRVPAIRTAHMALQDIAASSARSSKWWHVAAAILR